MNNKQTKKRSLLNETLYLNTGLNEKIKAAAQLRTTAIHSPGSDYPLKSCSPAELFSASSDKANLFGKIELYIFMLSTVKP